MAFHASEQTERRPEQRPRDSHRRRRPRWPQWCVLALGLGQALLSAVVFAPAEPGRLALLVVGTLLVLSALYSLSTPELRTEHAHTLLGAVLAGAPWACGFAGSGRPAQLCWLLGGVTALVGIASVLAPGGRARRAEPERVPAAETERATDPGHTRRVGELTSVTAQPAGRHHEPSELTSRQDTSEFDFRPGGRPRSDRETSHQRLRLKPADRADTSREHVVQGGLSSHDLP